MPLRPAVWKRCKEFLDPGDEIRYLLPATAVVPYTPGVMPFIIAVTDRRVVLLGCRWLRRNMPKTVWARYPRRIKLGPVAPGPVGGPTFSIGRMRFEVDEEYIPVINAADAEIADGDFLPPDPLPDL